MLQAFGKGRPFLVNPEATQFLAFQNCPQAILGSSASNLYRGAHLRARPFPTEYGVVGDTAWIMRYGHETRLALTPRRGSTFCIHEKESTMTHEMFMELHLRLLANETDRLGEGQQVSPMLAQALAHQEIRKQTKALQAKNAYFGGLKRIVWSIRPAGLPRPRITSGVACRPSSRRKSPSRRCERCLDSSRTWTTSRATAGSAFPCPAGFR